MRSGTGLGCTQSMQCPQKDSCTGLCAHTFYKADLVKLVCALSAQVVLARQDDHWLVEDLQADWTH